MRMQQFLIDRNKLLSAKNF